MTLFFKSFGFRVAKVMNKEFIEPQGDEDTWCKSTVKDYEANAKAQYRLTRALNDDLIITHERTSQVKMSKIDFLRS